MNPFYEKRSGKRQIGVSDNMNFPAHLHDDVEVLYCLEGGVQVSVKMCIRDRCGGIEDPGSRNGVVEEYLGNYSYYLEEKERRMQLWQAAYKEQQKQIKSMEKAMKDCLLYTSDPGYH